jgi:protein-tyrosine-phosphatase
MYLRCSEKKGSLLVNHLSLQRKIHVHFVCTGNAYRSRLAEAYLKGKQLSWLHVSSSGIAAEHHFLKNGPICWDAMRLIHKYHLIPFMSLIWTQTAPQHFVSADMVIFMCQEHYQYVKDCLGYQGICYQIWDIADMAIQGLTGREETIEYDIARIKSAEHTFECIREKVDFLVEDLRRYIEC